MKVQTIKCGKYFQAVNADPQIFVNRNCSDRLQALTECQCFEALKNHPSVKPDVPDRILLVIP